jgi:hypothetical protein
MSMDMRIYVGHLPQRAIAADFGGELVAGGTELPVVGGQSRCLVGVWIFYLRCPQEMNGWYGARANDLSYDSPGWPPAHRTRPTREGWFRKRLDPPTRPIRLCWQEVHVERLALPLLDDTDA